MMAFYHLLMDNLHQSLCSVKPGGHSDREKGRDAVGVKLMPHDLRRHAATHASRSGVPVEIVSKVILRHTNLSTTQRYLGKVTDTEAIRWIDNLYS